MCMSVLRFEGVGRKGLYKWSLGRGLIMMDGHVKVLYELRNEEGVVS